MGAEDTEGQSQGVAEVRNWAEPRSESSTHMGPGPGWEGRSLWRTPRLPTRKPRAVPRWENAERNTKGAASARASQSLSWANSRMPRGVLWNKASPSHMALRRNRPPEAQNFLTGPGPVLEAPLSRSACDPELPPRGPSEVQCGWRPGRPWKGCWRLLLPEQTGPAPRWRRSALHLRAT